MKIANKFYISHKTLDCKYLNRLTAKMWAISSDTHQFTLYPKAPLYNIIIMVDTVLRQKRNFMSKACPPPG